MDNIEAAIYQMTNDLIRLHGLRPIDFLAEFKERADGAYQLEFERPESLNGPEMTKYRVLMISLGINPDQEPVLEGNRDSIYDALERALTKSAKQDRGR